MKILHTSDLHLGKNLLEESLFEDQKDMLKQIIDIIKEEEIKVLLIPGDIYDKSIPSGDAINLFNDFLNNLNNMDIQVFITSGNHDSRERLMYGSKIFDKTNIHIVTEYNGKIPKYEIDGVVFYLLPFLKPYSLKKLLSESEYSEISTSEDMIKYILSKEKIDKTKKNILLLHQFVINKGEEILLSSSESGTNVGTLDAVSATLFDNFDYVALGHIHRPQKVLRETIRYSGSPLKYSFSEANDKKTVVIIDSDDMNITLKEIKPKRNLRVIKGDFYEIVSLPSSLDLIKVILTKEVNVASPITELRRNFPNILNLTFERNKVNDDESKTNISSLNEGPLSLFNNFFFKQNGRYMNNYEETYLKELIEEVKKDLI